MKRRASVWMIVGTTVALFSGCVTPPERSDLEAERAQQQNEFMRQKLERDQLKTDVERLREHVATLDAAREATSREVELSRLDSRRGDIDLQQRVATLDAAIKRLEASQAQMQGAIVEEISRRVADMLKAQTDAAAGAPPSSASASDRAAAPAKSKSATTHVVKRGESLSKIAEAYGVSSEALMEANGIRNANRVLVGQKLVIPTP